MSIALTLAGITESPYYLPVMIGLLVVVLVGFWLYKKRQANS